MELVLLISKLRVNFAGVLAVKEPISITASSIPCASVFTEPSDSISSTVTSYGWGYVRSLITLIEFIGFEDSLTVTIFTDVFVSSILSDFSR